MGLRTSHKKCPYNRLNDAPTPRHKDDDASPPHSDLSDDNLSFANDNSSVMNVRVPQLMTDVMKITSLATRVSVEPLVEHTKEIVA